MPVNMLWDLIETDKCKTALNTISYDSGEYSSEETKLNTALSNISDPEIFGNFFKDLISDYVEYRVSQ